MNSQHRTKLLVSSLALGVALLAPLFASASTSLGEPNLNVLSKGLVGYWGMDGGTINWGTGTMRDLSGQGNTGSLVGMSTSSSPVAGVIGQALSFNGSTSYISATPTIGTTATFSFWATARSFTQNMAFALAPGSPGPDLFFYSGLISWNTYDGDGNPFGPIPANATNGRYHQYVVVVQSGNTELYYDGTLLGTATYASPASTILQIGGQTTYFWNGSIDDFRLYNRALSPQEVQMLYETGTFALGNTPAENSSFSIDQGGLNSGLVAYWPLDGNTTNWGTGVTKDVSGNAFNGQMTGMSTSSSPVVGKIGQALVFNGSSYITTGYTVPAQSSATSFTWSSWLYVNTGNAGNDVIIGNRGGGGATWIKLTPTAFEFNGGLISHTLPTGQWLYVTIVKNGTNFTYYQNGAIIGTGTSSGTTSSYTFYMGEDPGYPGDGSYKGELDDVRVYNRALTQQEIAQLYAAGQVNVGHSNTNTTVGINSGLAGYWTFDGPTINWATGVAKDSSGNGNNGQLENMSTTSSPAIGKIGQALSFNGSSTYVDIPMTLTPSALTVSVWFRATSFAGINNPRLVANGHTDVDDKGFQLMFNSGGASGFFDVGNGSTNCTITWTDSLQVLTWYNYVGVYNGSSVTAYLNGVPLGSSSTGCSGAIASDSVDVNIGRNPKSVGDYFTGTLDDVRIYSRALSAQEVAQLYVASK